MSLIVKDAEGAFLFNLLVHTIAAGAILSLLALGAEIYGPGGEEVDFVQSAVLYFICCLAARSAPRKPRMPFLSALMTALFASVLYEAALIQALVSVWGGVAPGISLGMALVLFVNIVAGALAGVVMEMSLPKPQGS